MATDLRTGFYVNSEGSTTIHKIFETNSSFHVKESALRESSISIFQLFFTSIDKSFILGRGLSTRL